MKAMDKNRAAEHACAIVIFGSSGDLAQRKLLPALFSLEQEGRLDEKSVLVGFSRSETTHEAFRQRMRAAAEAGTFDAAAWTRFARDLYAVQGDYGDPASYARLKSELDRLDREQGTQGNRLFYLAVPPDAVPGIVRQLGAAGLVPCHSGRAARGWTRVVFEKPFGHDLASALALNKEISHILSEDQVYRIDHYLGKETVQNILVFRFANGIFEPLWNYKYVDHVQITVAESLGIGTRGRFYEGAGALRDIVQNHLLQLLTLVAMEPPVATDADAIRDEKVKVFRAVRPLEPGDVARFVVRSQYAAGTVDGKSAPGYRAESHVAPDSGTETYVALKLLIDNWRWSGVPFYLRTGKRLAAHSTEIVIRFSRIPHLLFRNLTEEQTRPNELVLHIQPDEGISLSFGTKAPGSELRITPVTMDFTYACTFGARPMRAYERLLLDAIRGDASLFIREDGVRATWAIVQPILDAWAAGGAGPVSSYPAGDWGPDEADALVERDGRRWRNPA